MIGGATTLNDANDLTVSSDYKRSRLTLLLLDPLIVDGTVGGATSDLTTTAAATIFGATTVGQEPVCDSYWQCKRHGQVGRDWNDCESALRVKR